MLFRLSPLSVKGPLIPNEVIFCVASSGLHRGLFPLVLLAWPRLMALWPGSNVAEGNNIVPGGYGLVLLMARGGLPVPASLRAGEMSRVLGRAGDLEQPFGGHPSSASSFLFAQCQHFMGCFTA